MKKIVSVCLALALCLACMPAALAAGMGDVADNDDEVTVSDARSILRAAVGLENFSDETAGKADMDLDGEISVSDARLALRAAVGLEVLDGNTYENQLDVLAGGHYYADVTIREADGEVRMVMAKTADSLYFDSVLGGMPMTMLSNGEGLYFINGETRTYGALTEEIKAMMTEMGGEDFGAETLTGELPDLGRVVSLDKAKKTAAEFDGNACDCYVVTEPSGVTRVYMNGPRLLAISTESRYGVVLSEIVFNAVLPAVPAACVRIDGSYTPQDFLEFLLENYAAMFEGEM